MDYIRSTYENLGPSPIYSESWTKVFSIGKTTGKLNVLVRDGQKQLMWCYLGKDVKLVDLEFPEDLESLLALEKFCASGALTNIKRKYQNHYECVG